MTDNQHNTPDTLDEPTSPAPLDVDDSAEAVFELSEADSLSAAPEEALVSAPDAELHIEDLAADPPLSEDNEPEAAPEAFAAAEPDVDAALSALSSLNVLAADAPREAFRPDEVTLSEALPQPPLATLERGTAASVVPALLLIGAGVFMTFYLASGNPMPAPQRLAGGGLILFGLSLVAWWWDTQRWARGSLLVGVLCIAGGAALFVL